MQSVKQSEGEHRPPNQVPQARSADVEIPARDWTSFLDSFSAQHEGWLVTILVTSGSKTSVKVRNARLECVTTSELQDERHIRIVMLGNEDEHLVHQVANPVGLTFRRSPSGSHEGLDITSADGLVTSLRFRVAAHPETLDDVLPDLRFTGTKHCAHQASRLREQHDDNC